MEVETNRYTNDLDLIEKLKSFFNSSLKGLCGILMDLSPRSTWTMSPYQCPWIWKAWTQTWTPWWLIRWTKWWCHRWWVQMVCDSFIHSFWRKLKFSWRLWSCPVSPSRHDDAPDGPYPQPASTPPTTGGHRGWTVRGIENKIEGKCY